MTEWRQPVVGEVVVAARPLVEEFATHPVPDAAIREVVERILFGRKEAWSAFEYGLLLETELVDLLAAHLVTMALEYADFRPTDQIGTDAAMDKLRSALLVPSAEQL